MHTHDGKCQVPLYLLGTHGDSSTIHPFHAVYEVVAEMAWRRPLRIRPAGENFLSLSPLKFRPIVPILFYATCDGEAPSKARRRTPRAEEEKRGAARPYRTRMQMRASAQKQAGLMRRRSTPAKSETAFRTGSTTSTMAGSPNACLSKVRGEAKLTRAPVGSDDAVRRSF